MVSIRVLILAVLLILALNRQVKQRRYNNQWITSGDHDFTCFTQGYSFINSTHMLESCGLQGKSYFHILEFTFKKQNQTSMKETYRSDVFPSNIFLEGSILFPSNQIIYILTWTQKIVYRFNSSDFTQILPRLQWTRGEGWGMTHNTTHIFISTGSNQIFVVDQNLNVLEVLPIVNERNIPIKNINEIEWVEKDGQQYIYANIWMTNEIVKISIKERKVDLRFDEVKMVSDSKAHPHGSRQDVLNGIAFNQEQNVFVLTGKFWPRYYVSYLDFVDF